MTTNPDPRHEEDDMLQYVLGQLDADTADAIERRAAGDPSFAAEIESVRRLVHLLPLAVATPPPAALRDRVLAAAFADEEKKAMSTTTAESPRPRALERPRRVRSFLRSRLAWSALAASAAALLVIAGLDNARLRRELALQHDVSDMLQQPNVVMSFAMKGGRGAPGAYGSVLLDLDAKRGAVALEGMPTAPPGRVYRLWAQVGTEAVYCGDLASGPAGLVRMQLPIPVESYSSPVESLFVTLEPVDAPLVPSGPRLVAGTPAPARG
ncbi:MAG: anti-sigma factor [Candidatus Eisenbacteria bacterium]